ncbi:MAG TPA: CRISPR-associated endonuclease Cas2, partial [Candidatus Atribacteria bacterium]|nr:CRISPR-associated endonuclease Cas2 [Candidatus Atribacteria bacterium]
MLLDFGRRVQYSVFEAHLDWSSLENLKERLQRVISQAEDSIRIYRICGECK